MNTNPHAIRDRIFRSSFVLQVMLCLMAFAANSIFCRQALVGGQIPPESFTVIRLLSGGLFVLLLIRLRNPRVTVGGSWKGGFSLITYAYLFSIGYVQLGAGMGALILFGAVQITMFIVSWMKGERFRKIVLIGMVTASRGVLFLLLPSGSSPPLGSAVLMTISGVACGAYSLLGKTTVNPLAENTGNFARCLPFLLLLAPVIFFGNGLNMSLSGVMYALASGVLASGCGYALWYSTVKHISSQNAATLQLSVPIIASFAGVLFLNEPLSFRLLLVSVMVLGGGAVAEP
ncbi:MULTISPECIES: DMT family transporter [unclassified Pseudomonas]|uniref:DMT family transporter n=1 Tax=unclassified Pseudomonas TaxID=196821 RepID=UPI00119AFB82|nr:MULTISPECIES: DMT family transporter [unclassified Pseudomonas]TWC22239.1 threonine/homoserine efflux transporter RhtA [Pseudomonas sp. SJZ083]TWC45061.1 threonine/homoserine efflux transporter RhtA [Pseudomonas sp. SJZ080]TWC48776.1 threonine/homoserine efflux transporter RhtA [Pseudomonas sp. SJZ077]